MLTRAVSGRDQPGYVFSGIRLWGVEGGDESVE